MPNKRYISGRAHEYAIKKKWEKDGWTVLRTAGSHGEFDLVAIQNKRKFLMYDDERLAGNIFEYRGDIVLIQAKSGKSAEKEKAKLEHLKTDYEGQYIVKVELL